ncbi:MAG: OmpA family protein [Nitrospira sp.]|nr:OmpA family protein [Nitrospira sp.]
MQKAPTASVSAGPVSPAVMGSEKEMKDVYILSGLVFFLAVVVSAFWYYSQTDEAAHSNPSGEALNSTQVSQVLKDSTDHAPVSASIPTTHVGTAPLATRSTDILHDDIHFEIGRKGLTDDGKAALQRHAEFLKSERDWGVLLQGYTDQQGSMSFNKILGMKRAETVKQHLIALGVPESSIRTVSLGEEGALCIDSSDVCRRMNRRVHVEMRKIGQEHMVVPPVATETVPDTFSNNLDFSIETGVNDTSSEGLPLTTSEPAERTSEPTDGN